MSVKRQTLIVNNFKLHKMCMYLTENVVKIIFIITNICCLLVGVIVLAISAYYASTSTNDYSEATPEDYQSVRHIPILGVCLGAAIFIIAFLGYYGEKRQSRWMLLTYAAVLFILAFLQISLAIFGLVSVQDKEGFQTKTNSSVTSLFKDYVNRREAVDLIQTGLQCCGTNSAEYWKTINATIPASCYDEKDKSLFKEGCSLTLFNFVMSYVMKIATLLLITSLVEIMCGLMALFLRNRIHPLHY